jgi:VCBS repeat-containing protein
MHRFVPRRLAVALALCACVLAASAEATTAAGDNGTGSRAIVETLPLPALQTGELGRMPRQQRNLEALIEGGREAAREAAGGDEAEREEAERERDEAEREDGAAISGPREEEGERPTPQANPDALPTRVTPPLRRSAGQKVAVTSPSGFDGPTLADTGAFPPDTQGDVGPSQYIVAFNGRIRSFTKATGAADGVMNLSTDAFFASVMTPTGTGGVVGNFTSDPHIRYDRLSGKWYIVIIDVPHSSVSPFTTVANRFLLAVSDGPTITASTVWSKFFWDEDLAGRTDAQFADYPTLGIDQNALYIGANMFGSSGNGAFSGTRAYVVQKSSVQGAGPIVVTKFSTGTSSTGTFTPQGVDDRTGTSTVGWFVGVDNAVFSQLNLYKVTNPGTATPTLSAALPLTVPTTASPKTVPHLGNLGGTNGNLDALDDRLYAANLRDGHIWTAHNISVSAAGVASTASGSRDASRWYDVNVSSGSPALTQSGTVFDTATTNPLNYWIPSVNVNGQGTMALGGSVAGAAARVNTFFTGRKAGDTSGATDVPTLGTGTGAAYNPGSDPGGGSGRRWGDYSFVSVDPDDDQTMWSIQEYVNATNSYAVHVTKLRAAAPTVATIAPSTLVKQPGVTHLTMTGTGFFEPGAAFPNHLTITSDCGATNIAITGTPTPTTITFDATAPASGSCTFTATNPDGQSAAATAVPTSTNSAPVAVADSATTPRDTPLNGTSVLANDTDADADPLTAQKVGDPAHGSVTLAADGTYVYTPAAGYAGPDAFTYRASDGAATSNVATVSLTVDATNRAPVAVGDVGTTPRDIALNGTSVLANDTDADGNTLTAQKDGDPAHGSVTLAADGTYVYTPASGYAGPDAFTYKASDGAASSNVATVSLTVDATNRKPVAVDDTGTTVQDTALTGTTVLANDSDPDGNTLQAFKASDPAHGTVTVAPDGTFVYLPAAGYTGPDSFTYDASDGALAATATVRLTVLAPAQANRAPVATGDKATTPRNVVLKGPSVLGNDSDPDGDALTAVKATDPKHGKVSLAAGGTYVYTPAAGYTGPDAFTYKASDGSALSAAATVSLTVTKPKTCKIPKTKGLTVTKAKAALKKAGCGKVVVKRVRTTKVKRGRVLSSSPAARKTVSAKAKVTLKVRR